MTVQSNPSIMRYILFMLLLVFGNICFVYAQPISVSADLEKILTAKFRTDEPGVAVLVTEKGKTLLRKGYGISNLESNTFIEPGMVFRIGSITKQFTSTAILKLAEQGKLSLQDDIAKYLPEFKAPGRITIEHLLNHTSGIKSYTSLAEIMSKEVKAKSITINDMLKVIEKQPADFAPGDQWLYNNSGYYLLGAIIEKVSGVSYNDYLEKTFFKPIGMKSTYVNDYKEIPNQAIGYAKATSTEYKIADYVHPTVPYAAGSIWSTVDDLKKWNDAVFGYKVVKKEWLEKAWTPTKLNNGTLQSYGYGWQLGRVGTAKAIGHGGGIDGFLSFELYVPDKQIYVCVLLNHTGTGPEDLAYTLAETVAGVSLKKPEPITLEEKLLELYTGVYKINDTEERVITRNGTQMYSQRSGGDKLEIYPFAQDKFAFKESGTEIHFHRDASGKVLEMELVTRSLINQKAVKTNKPIPADRVIFDFNPEDFDAFVGEYELGPGFIIKVWREEAVYKAQATSQPPFEIFPESPTKFFLKVVDAQIEFSRDEHGAVSQLTLFQGGRTMPGKKLK